MNGSKSPGPAATEARSFAENGQSRNTANGQQGSDADEKSTKSTPVAAEKHDVPHSSSSNIVVASALLNSKAGDNDDGDSEAETLIDSPVKRKEAEKQQQNMVKSERPHRHRIGSLPVPTDGDEDDSALQSPVPSTVMSMENETTDAIKDEELDGGDHPDPGRDDESDSLSSPRSPRSNPHSRGSSLSRAASELPDVSRNTAQSPNPRKRKHRASSVSVSNKRLSTEPPKRRLRGLHSEEVGGRTEESLSPKVRNHRRAVSTQSAFADGTSEISGRKRRSITQNMGRESKAGRAVWEESDASSETTSHGQAEKRRPQRGVGRSTSTPGRPVGRESKRYTNKYGFTRLAEACEIGDLDTVKHWRDKDPDQLELAEFAGNKPLQIAALNGNVEVVNYLIDQGCQIDCANVDKDTPLIDAAENGHIDTVHSLLDAGVDPLRQNLKGQQALDVVTDDTDDADLIRDALRKAIEQWNSNGSRQRREEEEEMRHRAGPTKELHFMARTYENLLRLVQINDRNGVKEFLDARVPVDNQVIAAAAKTGDSYLVNMLLAEMTEKKARQKPERPMLSVLGTSHFEMVKALSVLDTFDPCYRDRKGKSWPEIAEEKHGPNWREEKELLQELYDKRAVNKERRSSSPVTKRDSTKRRSALRGEDNDSDEDQAPRRKNGRRLMSKRDMRAASGKASSDESSEESSTETTTGENSEEASMKPPPSPVTRSSGKPRTRSFSAQSADQSPRLRRRSSSLRGTTEQILPTLAEGGEDAVAVQRRQDEEKAAVEAAAKREEQAAAEAAEAAKLAAEEEVRAQEERRLADERRRLEEERMADEARQAEEERTRIEQEVLLTKRRHREQVLASLPDSVSHVLGCSSGFDYDSVDAPKFLIYHFTPLQVLKHEHQDPYSALPAGTGAPFWVSNVQAAPLVGPQALELMLSEDAPGYEGSLADTWETKDMSVDDRSLLNSALAVLPQHLPNLDPMDLDLHDGMAFDQEVRRAAEKAAAAINMKKRIHEGAATLRYVRLDEVLKNLHPTLRHTPIEVRFDYLQTSNKEKSMQKNDGDFVTKLSAALDARPRPRSYVDGRPVGASARRSTGMTEITVTYQK